MVDQDEESKFIAVGESPISFQIFPTQDSLLFLLTQSFSSRGIVEVKLRSAAPLEESEAHEESDHETVLKYITDRAKFVPSQDEDRLQSDDWPDVDYLDIEDSPLVLLATCIARALELAGQPGTDRALIVEALRDLASAAVVDGADPSRVVAMLPHLDAALDFGSSSTSRSNGVAAASAAQQQRLSEALETHVPSLFDGGPGLQARRGRITVAIVVGWPGAGKTTLCARLVQNYQSRGIPCSVVCAPLPASCNSIPDPDRHLINCVRAGGGLVYEGMEDEKCAGVDDPVQFARRGVEAVLEQDARRGSGSMVSEGGVILVDTESAWPGPGCIADSGIGQSTIVVGAAKQLVAGLRPDHVLLVIDASAGPVVARRQVRAMLAAFSRSTMSVACVRLKEGNGANCPGGGVAEAQDGSEETLDVGGGRGTSGAAVLGALAASRCTVSVVVVGDTADDVGGFDAHRFLTALLLDAPSPLAQRNDTHRDTESARATRRRGRKARSAVLQRGGSGSGEWTWTITDAAAAAAAGKDRLGVVKEEERLRDPQADSFKAPLRRGSAASVSVEVLRSEADSRSIPQSSRATWAGRGWVRREKSRQGSVGEGMSRSVQAVLGDVGDLEGIARDLMAQGVPQHVLSELIHLARQLPPGSHTVPLSHVDRGLRPTRHNQDLS